MNCWLRASVMLVFSASAITSFAQSSCEAVYASSTRNIDAVSKQAAEYKNQYSKHCEENGSLRTSSSSQDLSVAYAGIEVGWKGTNAEAQQAMQKFCKTRHSQYSNASSFIANTSTVVEAALNLFNQCKLLEGKSLFMSHTADVQSVIIRGDFNPDVTRVVIDSVIYQKTTGTCVTTSIRPPRPVQVDDRMPAFVPKGTFTITCTRQGMKIPDGTVKYPAFSVMVATNIGTYAVSLLSDDILNFNLAEENKRLHERNNLDQKLLISELDQENLKADALKKSIAGIVVTSHRYDDIHCGGFGGVCPAPSKLIGSPVNLGEGGGQCGYAYYAYSCIAIPGQ